MKETIKENNDKPSITQAALERVSAGNEGSTAILDLTLLRKC